VGAVAEAPPEGRSATEDELRKQAEAAEAEGGPSPAPEDPSPNGTGPDAEHEGEQPGEGAGEQAEPALAIHGKGQLSLTVGGATPDKSEVKLRGGSIEMPQGQFKKGEIVNLMVKVQVAEVHLVDKIDNSTGEITGTVRRHVAKIKGVEQV
jgi:hypothetical protein